MSHATARTRVLGVNPLGRPDPGLAAAVARGGGLGIVPIGSIVDGGFPFGVRIPAGRHVRDEEVRESGAGLVLLAEGAVWRGRACLPVLAEVTGVEQAVRMLDAGASGLVAKGAEAGGSDLTTFVLLQRLLERFGEGVPVWAYGGIGPRTAVAAIAGGAAGVVLDGLGLFPEADVPDADRVELARADDGLSAMLENRFEDAESAVRSVVRSLAVPAAIPADQGERLCRTLGTRLPVVQGPMTRVSDQPGFAAAVAANDGFPFVAVATANGAKTAELLGRTAEALGDRPWGAGILGFVPEDLRVEQLAAIRAARPRCVLIAGGKPAQAKALEADGIATFLHVPSPILLRQFLDAGIRRFVFEGAECGGHIGPRSSFVLWEQQLDVLRERGADDVEILFAGGIHDARSAAMVSAMAEPLTGIGVLMGTAYLFTEEAVTHGAITGTFQDRVLDAGSTVTLETAPGHLTRCLPSPYTDEFAALKAGLRADGVPPQEAWQRLEELNTGRLRIASKGIRRDGDALVEVDTLGQLAEGMYMAGQVTVLREDRTDIATLHREVTESAAELLAARGPVEESVVDGDIAIVGMACVFPGAPDLPAFWSNVLRGADAVTEVPDQRWDTDVYADQSTSKWGGFLPPVDFDPLAYGIPPKSMGSIDPAQLVSLQTARRALEDAGYGEGGFDRERTSVIFGAEAGGDLANAGVLRALLPSYLEDVPEELLSQLPELTEDSFPGTLANVISGRIANRLDLGGANYTVDAACGSSLAALDLAVKELRAGTSSMVLCGAVDLHNGVNDYLMFTSAGALSPTGRCRPFDASADGIALGEGVACLVLKRRSDAERDGDRVYAVVKGVGAASDGKALGLTAPRPEGQRRALARAYRDAGVSPADVSLVEAHGTGTVVGDATELTTLTEFFLAAGAEPGTCALGSVKSQIGHTKCAAGLAGLMKAALALWHEVVPPTLHLSRPNPAWDAERSPFTFSTGARPTPVPRGREFAGVSAFGFGGTNFHAVLAAPGVPPGRRHGPRDWDAELVLLRGADVDAARATLRELLAANEGRPLREIAALAAERGGSGPVRLAVVASDVAELREAAENGGMVADDTEAGAIAFLFPGQGSQRTGMLADLFVHFPELADVLRLAPDVAATAFPPRAFTEDARAAQDEALKDTRLAQPALGLVESAVCRLLADLGVRPDLLAGHSYGELTALSVAGAFDTPTLVALSRARARSIAEVAGADPGAMAAVKASREELAAVLDHPDVVPANHNAPGQTVLSGPTAAIEEAVRELRAQGIGAKRIPVACAFHSPLVAGASDVFAVDLDNAEIGEPGPPVWSNRTARPYEAGAVRTELAAQIGSPVRFVELIEDMYAAGARTFVEAGPGQVLSRLVKDILGDRPHTVIACDPGGPGLRGFLTALARLALTGVDVRTERLFRGRVRVGPLPKPAWTVDGQTVRAPGGEIPAQGLVPARRIPRTTMNQPTPGRDQAVVEFLRTSREMLAAQRDVMLGYLGTAPLALAPVQAPVLPALLPPVEAPVVVPEPEPAPEAVVTDVLATVIGAISERTGYPAEMIDADLDLEADLSIDSIKRTEIAGSLLAKLGLTGRVHDDAQDQLSRDRTASALAARLRKWLEPAAVTPAPAETPAGSAPGRYLLDRVSAPLGTPDLAKVDGKSVAVSSEPDQEDLAESVRAVFAGAGAVPGERDEADVVVVLNPLSDAEEPVAPQIFSLLKSAKGAVVVVARPGAGHTAGLRGLVRAAARERSEPTRLVELESTVDLARIVLEEVIADGPVAVRYDTAGRAAFEPSAGSLGSIAYAGAGPGGGEVKALGLDADSVLLLIGGARGITARAAVALAASGCRIELAGRTPWPAEPGDEDLPGDAPGMRSALAARGGSLADIERRVRTVLAQREIARTLDQIRAAGGVAAYRSLDVRDAAAVRQVVKDLHTRYGRIDGVVHAAGVIDDKLMADKDEQSFRTVYGTKVDGARALLDALEHFGVRPGFVTFFGSIAAVLGNRGQTDYAAANDALETLGEQWAERTGCRALTVHWGPWAPSDDHAGMVSPELAREYERREVALIDPDEGTAALLRELAYGPADVRSVLYTASLW
ncbi:type I polyketide synthase [Amycolatopsis roodepoortensis]|uniref:Acyl transferase domain-containing protein/NAD(P)H-dependent flavin oxidoreductase YrpB (Nitropropane dioxygenase family) n=1 Tax=Amycolatopsis roodepoortensis TaxID=700274 RepID=A0ABR9L0J2_9PSEU|nr:type I polyketide synthase [Amycolatopsis roodepoortensis]MBE1574145.1 acyl transferase domain-containing protein/NAD(P)H-dependent flavin oxidoreductase YrpB (nitropropane dioxygenase family) [Amycolatopsis roodepoortensis]